MKSRKVSRKSIVVVVSICFGCGKEKISEKEIKKKSNEKKV